MTSEEKYRFGIAVFIYRPLHLYSSEILIEWVHNYFYLGFLFSDRNIRQLAIMKNIKIHYQA